MERLKQLWTLIKQTASSFSDDRGSSMGAAIAYYTMFSIAPLLFIVIMVAGLVFGEEAARGEIFSQLAGLMGRQGASAVQTMVESVREPAKGILGTIVGVAALLLGATTVFAELQSALDQIWRAPARAKLSGMWKLLRTRLLSFGLILGIGFLLIVSLVASAALAALGKWWGPMLGGWEVLAQLLNFALSFALFTLAFALIYKLMPRVKIEWHDVWIGALVTAALFTIGKFLIGLYIGKSAIASGFGAAGSVVVVVVWVYYSAQIFLFGAEFTWVYANTYGSHRGKQSVAAKSQEPQRAAAGGGTAAPVRAPSVFVPARDPALLPARVVSPPIAFGLGCLLTALVALLPDLAPRRRHF